MKRVAICVLLSGACSTSPSASTSSGDAGHGGAIQGPEGPIPDASSTVDSSTVDSSTVSSTVDAGIPDATSPEGGAEATATTPGAHVRFADWTSDAPAAGFSFCLSPNGTSTWMGPFLPQGLPFPGTAGAYADVPPGSYEVQVVAAPGGDCSTGVIPASYGLPTLVDGTYATIATLGNLMPSGGDASMKVAAFLDDVSGTPGGLRLRAINAGSEIGYAEIGTGSQAAGNFSVVFPDVAFGTAATMTVDGGTTDPNGYALLGPLSGVELSAYPVVGNTTQSATASQVSLGAGIAATLVIVGAADNGPPPQIVICNDVAAAGGAASPCTLYSQ